MQFHDGCDPTFFPIFCTYVLKTCLIGFLFTMFLCFLKTIKHVFGTFTTLASWSRWFHCFRSWLVCSDAVINLPLLLEVYQAREICMSSACFCLQRMFVSQIAWLYFCLFACALVCLRVCLSFCAPICFSVCVCSFMSISLRVCFTRTCIRIQTDRQTPRGDDLHSNETAIMGSCPFPAVLPITLLILIANHFSMATWTIRHHTNTTQRLTCVEMCRK